MRRGPNTVTDSTFLKKLRIASNDVQQNVVSATFQQFEGSEIFTAHEFDDISSNAVHVFGEAAKSFTAITERVFLPFRAHHSANSA